MAAKLQIVIDAENQTAAGLGQAEKDIKAMGAAAKDSGAQMTGANKATRISFTEINSAVNLAKQAYQMVGQAIDATVTPTIALAKQQRELATASGTSAEEAGVMIQVADDLTISEETLAAGFKKLNKDGMQPNIENLILLSDQYNALPDSVSKAQFAADKFGKAAGPEMQKMLSLSRTELQAMTQDARDSGMVLSNEAVAGARAYEIAQDNLADATQALAMEAGQELIPALTQLATFTTTTVVPVVGKFFNLMGQGVAVLGQVGQIMELNTIKYQLQMGAITQQEASARAWLITTEDQRLAEAALNVGMDESERAIRRVATATDADTASKQANKIAQDAVNDSLSILKMNMAGAVGNEMEQFRAKQEELRGKADEYRAKIDELNGKQYLTPEQSDELTKTQGLYAETTVKIDENAKMHDEATKKILFNIVEQRLAMGGMTEEEAGFLTTLALKWGLVDQATADATLSIITGVGDAEATGNWDALYGRLQGTADRLNGGSGSVTQTANDAKNALFGIPAQVNSTITITTVHEDVYTSGQAPGQVGHAAGGPYEAGVPAWVGERGPELLFPSSDGYVMNNSDSKRFIAALEAIAANAGRGGGGGAVNMTMHNQINNGLDIVTLARAVAREIQRRG